jgi:PAS domain S-box-containing protein
LPPRPGDIPIRGSLDDLSDLVWRFNASGGAEAFNTAWIRYTGGGATRFGGHGWLEALHPDDAADAERAWSAAVAAETAFERALRVRAENGTYRWFLARAYPQRDADERVAGWIGVLTDIDALKHAEQEVRAIGEALPQLVYVGDPSGRITRVNERFVAYTGRPRELLLGSRWIDVAHPDDLPESRAALARGNASRESVEWRIRLRRADGVYRWFVSRAAPVFGNDGAIATWVGTATDVDDEVRASKKAQRSAALGDALARSLDLDSTLAATLDFLIPDFADWGMIHVRDDDESLRVAAFRHRHRSLDERGSAFLGMTLLPDANLANAVTILDDIDERGLPRELAARSGVLIALVSGGDVRGVVQLISETRRDYAGEREFFAEIGRRVAIALGNALAYERERRVAESFQRSAMRSPLPNVPRMEFDALYLPGRSEERVGGDWYDAIRLLDGRVLLSVGDVAGSGIDAAVTMATVREAIRAVATINPDPRLMLDAADRVLRAESSRFATAWVGVIDPVDFSIAFATAGHPAPFVRYADGSVVQLAHAEGGPPLGVREGLETDAAAALLPNDATMFLYTDGLSEAQRDVIAGEARIADALANAGPMRRGFAAEIRDRVAAYGDSGDDVAILAVALDRPLLDAPGRDVLHWSFTVDDAAKAMGARAQLVAALADRGFAREHVFAAELTFGELIGNVVRHAGGAVDALLDLSHDEAAVLHVLDRGDGYFYNPKLPADTMSEGGRGLYIIATLCREYTVSKRIGGGSHARAVLAGRSRQRPALRAVDAPLRREQAGH